MPYQQCSPPVSAKQNLVHASSQELITYKLTDAWCYCLQGAVCCAAASRGCQIWQVAHVPVLALQGHEGRRQHQEGGGLCQEAAANCPGAAAFLHLWLPAHAVRDPQGDCHLRSVTCAVVRFLC